MSKKVSKEEVLFSGELGVVQFIERRRSNGTLRIQQDFSACPTMCEQHTAHLSDVNYLVEKYKPDELAAYLVARSGYRQEILGHDFSEEPSLQEGLNVMVRLREAFAELPDHVKVHFKNHVEFVKFIDNPANADKMVALGLMTRKEVKANSSDPIATSAQPVGASSGSAEPGSSAKS